MTHAYRGYREWYFYTTHGEPEPQPVGWWKRLVAWLTHRGKPTMPDGMIKRPSKLKAVAPEAVEPKKPKVLIYGPPGVGKTWASLDFPSVYYIDTEGGADLDHYRSKPRNSGGAYLGPDQGSLDFDVVIGQMQARAVERHPFRTVVIDSISKL